MQTHLAMARRTSWLIVAATVASLCGCEWIVQIDRSLVDAGGEDAAADSGEPDAGASPAPDAAPGDDAGDGAPSGG